MQLHFSDSPEQQLRNRLFEKVRSWRWTPEWGEAVAGRLKLPPLNPAPDPARFDPMREACWTLGMVVAWGMWRDPARVRWGWDRYRLESFGWSEPHDPAMSRLAYDLAADLEKRRPPVPRQLERRAPASTLTLELTETYTRMNGGAPILTLADASESVARALRAANAPALDGKPSRNGRRELIPSLVLRDLQVDDTDDREPSLCLATPDGAVRYYDVQMARDDVFRVFPPLGADEQPADCHSTPVPKTGTPGRPSSIHHALDELERRAKENKTAPTVIGEARVLQAYVDELRKTQPDLPPLVAVSIKNRISARYRELKAEANLRAHEIKESCGV
jgi:hypothetical protein